MTAGCENATTGGAQEDWGCAGLAEQGQGDQERSRRVVTDVSLQGSSGGLGVCRAGLRTGQGPGNSPGGWSQMCHYRAAQDDWGCAGLAKQGQGDREHSRRMVTAVSLQGCSGGLHVCRAGLSTGQGDRELSRRMVTAVSLQGCSGELGVCRAGRAGAEGLGKHQEDGLSYSFVWLHVSL